MNILRLDIPVLLGRHLELLSKCFIESPPVRESGFIHNLFNGKLRCQQQAFYNRQSVMLHPEQVLYFNVILKLPIELPGTVS